MHFLKSKIEKFFGSWNSVCKYVPQNQQNGIVFGVIHIASKKTPVAFSVNWMYGKYSALNIRLEINKMRLSLES